MIGRVFMLVMLGVIATGGAYAADADAPTVRRVSIFSTSTDWEGITGLNLAEYRGTFVPDKKLVGNKGLILYYLDGFPCYGLGSWARAWISPSGRADEHLRIVCIYPPREIKFAYRNATADAVQAVTTGMLTCPVTTRGREMTIDLGGCAHDGDWTDMK